METLIWTQFVYWGSRCNAVMVVASDRVLIINLLTWSAAKESKGERHSVMPLRKVAIIWKSKDLPLPVGCTHSCLISSFSQMFPMIRPPTRCCQSRGYLLKYCWVVFMNVRSYDDQMGVLFMVVCWITCYYCVVFFGVLEICSCQQLVARDGGDRGLLGSGDLGIVFKRPKQSGGHILFFGRPPIP